MVLRFTYKKAVVSVAVMLVVILLSMVRIYTKDAYLNNLNCCWYWHFLEKEMCF